MKIRDKVLVYAIAFSAVWHIFWLSAFTVIVVPKAGKPVKFSSVAFLGPILDRSVLSVNVKPHESTAQEARYIDSMDVNNVFSSRDDMAGTADILPVSGMLSAADEEEFTALIVSKIETNKIEPGRDVN